MQLNSQLINPNRLLDKIILVQACEITAIVQYTL